MYNRPKGKELYHLKEKAKCLAESDYCKKPFDYLDTCMKLKFFKEYFTLCQELVKKVTKILKLNDSKDFEIYRLLFDAGSIYLDLEAVEFAFEKMQETKRKAKHKLIIFNSWCKIQKFPWLAEKIKLPQE